MNKSNMFFHNYQKYNISIKVRGYLFFWCSAEISSNSWFSLFRFWRWFTLKQKKYCTIRTKIQGNELLGVVCHHDDSCFYLDCPEFPSSKCFHFVVCSLHLHWNWFVDDVVWQLVGVQTYSLRYQNFHYFYLEIIF